MISLTAWTQTRLTTQAIAMAVCTVAVLSTAGSVSAQSLLPDDFCGRPRAEPAALFETISKTEGFKQVFDGPEYVAFQDPATETVFTFSRSGLGQAHPAAVCRKPRQVGQSITLQMVVICRGAVDACQRLESEFKLLNAKMEAHIRGQTGAAADRPK